MNSSALRRWDMPPSVHWHDAPTSTADGLGVMEWEANLLLPQMSAAREHPCPPTPTNHLLGLWRALRKRIHQPRPGTTRQ